MILGEKMRIRYQINFDKNYFEIVIKYKYAFQSITEQPKL